TGGTPRWLRAERGASGIVGGDAPWGPPHKGATRHLAPHPGGRGRVAAGGGDVVAAGEGGGAGAGGAWRRPAGRWWRGPVSSAGVSASRGYSGRPKLTVVCARRSSPRPFGITSPLPAMWTGTTGTPDDSASSATPVW